MNSNDRNIENFGLQPASLDIWDEKYRLKDKAGAPVDNTVTDTFFRVATALSGAERSKEGKALWFDKFLWALHNGAVPAGRIVANAGAKEHKPATSLINCTVSGTIGDSMNDIMNKVHDGAMTLRAGCGIGYSFSTLRPRGAFVEGAGASTSGPISFMDVYDKMCFTVASAGGRRGAQMATFDISHPDVVDFINAKKEDGRLRQFNLSLLITEQFMEAVKKNALWPLVFPIKESERSGILEDLDVDAGSGDDVGFTLREALSREFVSTKDIVWREWPIHDGLWTREDGLVACRVYSTIRAVDLWAKIMESTYDYAEPGFILIDRINEDNNNWWCENIQATNPCVSGDTEVLTKNGNVRIDKLVGLAVPIWNGRRWSVVEPRVTGKHKNMLRVVFSNGRSIKCTPNHKFFVERDHGSEKVDASDLHAGQKIAPFVLPETGPGKRIHLSILSVEALKEKEDRVYCFTEDECHAGVFSGVLTGQCGEQPLSPYSGCLLGSVNLTKLVTNPFTENAQFDWDKYKELVRIFTRMLDNVVEMNGLPLEKQRNEILEKRRHGMGFLGLGSTFAMLGMKYGSDEAVKFTERVSKTLAVIGWEEALSLAKEKGPAPIMEKEFAVTNEMLRLRPEMAEDGFAVGDVVRGAVLHSRYSRYMKKIAEVIPDVVDELSKVGARFTHHSSIAPTGTISLSLGNNASNGIEPSFAHSYTRNVIRSGRNAKESIRVSSYEFMAYMAKLEEEAGHDIDPDKIKLPSSFITSDAIAPKKHVVIQAAAQKWIDSSISKTINIPTDFPFEEFEDIYMYAYENGLKGCTTFRYNPDVFTGVLVKDKDLEATEYQITLKDGTEFTLKGSDKVEYQGEVNTVANLHDAIKEGYYGRY